MYLLFFSTSSKSKQSPTIVTFSLFFQCWWLNFLAHEERNEWMEVFFLGFTWIEVLKGTKTSSFSFCLNGGRNARIEFLQYFFIYDDDELLICNYQASHPVSSNWEHCSTDVVWHSLYWKALTLKGTLTCYFFYAEDGRQDFRHQSQRTMILFLSKVAVATTTTTEICWGWFS